MNIGVWHKTTPLLSFRANQVPVLQNEKYRSETSSRGLQDISGSPVNKMVPCSWVLASQAKAFPKTSHGEYKGFKVQYMKTVLFASVQRLIRLGKNQLACLQGI